MITREDVEQNEFGAGLTRLEPIPPGEILRTEFLVPLGLSARALARDLNVTPNRITGILNGERGITAETAIMLGKRLKTSPRFWLNLQIAYDLARAERAMQAA